MGKFKSSATRSRPSQRQPFAIMKPSNVHRPDKRWRSHAILGDHVRRRGSSPSSFTGVVEARYAGGIYPTGQRAFRPQKPSVQCALKASFDLNLSAGK
jgi:hypothetical protein